MLDKKRNDVINSHLKLFKVYKELKTILPSGFIKTNIYSSIINSPKNQSKSMNSDKKEIDKVNNDKLTKELNTNKNIYTFSEGNNCQKKLISKFKNSFSFSQIPNELTIFNNDNNNFSYDAEESKSKIMKKIKLVNFKNNFLLLNTLNKKNKETSKSKLSYNEIKLNYELNITRKYFRSSSINNSIMKTNIQLPSITNRLKSKLPRYEREKCGLKLKGFKKNNLQSFFINKKEINKGIDKPKKYRKIKFNKLFHKNFMINNIQNISKIKEINQSYSFINKNKLDDAIELKSIKKLKNNLN